MIKKKEKDEAESLVLFTWKVGSRSTGTARLCKSKKSYIRRYRPNTRSIKNSRTSAAIRPPFSNNVPVSCDTSIYVYTSFIGIPKHYG